MPALVFLGRRWQVGSDDFVLPDLVTVALRSLWIAGLAVIYTHASSRYGECDGFDVLQAYLLAGLGLYGVVVILELVIVRTSLQGSILNSRARKAIPSLLLARLALSVLELAFAGWGVDEIFFQDRLSCEEDLDNVVTDVLHAIIIANWCLVGIELVSFWLVFDPMGSIANPRARSEYRATEAYAKAWASKLRCLFCCVSDDLPAGSSSQTAFGNGQIWMELAQLLAGFFKHLDVVPSDIAAGLAILRARQRVEERRRIISKAARVNGAESAGSSELGSNSRPLSPRFTSTGPLPYYPTANGQPATRGVSRSFLSGTRPATRIYDQVTQAHSSSLGLHAEVDAADLAEVHHFGKLALGIYGWPLYLFMHLCTGLCRLNVCNCEGTPCCNKPQFARYDISNAQTHTSRPATTKDVYVGDNCCSCNLAALKKQSGLNNCDIAYVSFSNRVFETPFYVAIDHSRRCVVITVRGTLSFDDAVVDLIAAEEKVRIPGTDFDSYVHRGIFHAAQGVKTTLDNVGVLKALLGPGGHCEGFGLVVIGHSLGAGTASLLTLLLRPEHPEVTCYAYSCPGAMVSHELSRYCQDFIISIVLGKDVVPRLGRRNAELLRDQLVHAVSASRAAKWNILGHATCSICCSPLGCCCGTNHEAEGEFTEDRARALGLDVEIDIPSARKPQTQQPTSRQMSDVTTLASNPEPASLLSSSSSSPPSSSHGNSQQPASLRSSGRAGYSALPTSDEDESASLLGSYNRARASDPEPVAMYMPGRVLHMVKTKSRTTHCGLAKERVYAARWAEVTEFDHILVSPLMVADHMPDKVMAVLGKLVSQNAHSVSDV
ncbi:hypothetical protein CAOG_05624 [Capsaspora owczarzaki ATCC 30864]|uniref:hypothetical protein n=1 Tax=Capsaspora owczarzaki (strain ATCC 30864) TaxID=595528 RepID=UPI0001FE2F7A|nr:hypothetical protein CAOG_05624 [Capsaspora owczarzaki ATCC 30864]|eukprot:XP_004346297.1 hypothetical protein CAOG_05624 [Capsaspora owczarzaki ATCC 30864]